MLVTIATFSDPLNAHIMRGRLESEGIEVVLTDEHIIAANWLYANAVGGVKLKVRGHDVERALAVLASVEQSEATDGTAEPCGDLRRGAPPSEDPCPQCASKNVRFQRFAKRLVFASWLVLGFPLPFLKKRWVCRDCQHSWQ